MKNSKRQLLWHGMFVFLLGLILGLVEQQFTNPRMGLSAHLEGLMNGTFLVVVGAIWNEVRLSPRIKMTVYWAALYGAYANVLTTGLAALFGTSAMTPLASMGYTALSWQEHLITFGFASLAVAMVASLVSLLWGLRGDIPES